MNNYTVLTLGPSGSGKTVFLASMYKKLSTQGEYGFFLEVDSSNKRKRLKNIYTEIALDEKWPKGTKYSEISEWTFTCRVQTEKLPIYSACEFTYLDYAGGRLTDEVDAEEEVENEDDEFEIKLKEADALLGLLDGQKIYQLMREEKDGKRWAINDLTHMLDIMQKSNNPIHFVISKWDILQGNYSLEAIKERLQEIEEFRNLIKTRNQSQIPIRLIPVSSVGMNFATLEPDGSMKKTGEQAKPFQVEIPLACVLPDVIETKLKKLIEEKQEEENRKIEVKANFNWWDKLRDLIGDGFGIVKDFLPEKYQLPQDILEKIIKVTKEPVQKKQEAAEKRSEELRKEQAESLKAIEDEQTALKHAINCFLTIQYELNYKFPASDLR